VRCRLLAEAAGRPRPGRLSVPTSGVPTGRAFPGRPCVASVAFAIRVAVVPDLLAGVR